MLSIAQSNGKANPLTFKKRGREDTGISKDEYEYNETRLFSSTPTIGIQKAATPLLEKRKIVLSKQQKYAIACQELNESFLEAIDLQLKHGAHKVPWLENAREYVVHARYIQATYGDKRGKVLTFGSGDCGQLAHGVEKDKDMIVKYPREVMALRKFHIIKIACGGIHTAAVSDLGQVYTWGCNDDGALGRSGEENVPLLVDGFPAGTMVNEVVAGDSHTAVSTLCEQVYTWGCYKDKDGKQWCDALTAKTAFKNKQTSPFHIKALSNVVDLKCGDAFNIVRTADGAVYSWGLGEMGQLGRPVTKEIKNVASGEYLCDIAFAEHLTPKAMVLNDKKLPPVQAIGCGGYHSLVALADGRLYTTGLNNYGQLGINSTENSWELLLVNDLSEHNIIMADGGAHHSVVLTSQSKLFAFGRGDSGQLGSVDNPKTGYFSDAPVPVTIPDSCIDDSFEITMITCGANHTMVLGDNNNIYSWGYGDMLALGNGKESDESKPCKLDWSKSSFGDAKVLQVRAGGQHSAVLAVAKHHLT